MMSFINRVTLEGEVQNLKHSLTRSGVPCSTFILIFDSSKEPWSRIRVNAFDAIASASKSLKAGVRVVIDGKLMSRITEDGSSVLEFKMLSFSGGERD